MVSPFFSLDTRNDPRDVFAHDPVDLPPAPNRWLVMVVMTYFHVGVAQRFFQHSYTYEGESTHEAIVSFVADVLYDSAYPPQIDWHEVPNQIFETYRTRFTFPCTISHCRYPWHADVVLQFQSMKLTE